MSAPYKELTLYLRARSFLSKMTVANFKMKVITVEIGLLLFISTSTLAQVTIDNTGGTYTPTSSPINSMVGGANTATGGTSNTTVGDTILTTGASTSAGGAGGSSTVGNLTTGASNSTVGNLTTGASNSTVGNLTTGASNSTVGNVSTGASTSAGGSSTVGNLSTGASTSAGGAGGSSNANTGASTSSGNISGNTTITSTYVAAKIPVATAVAPSNFPTAPCMGSSSVGGSAVLFGFSIGSSWEATECMTFEAARSFDQAGMHEDALAIKCTSKYAAAAPSCIKLRQQQVQREQELLLQSNESFGVYEDSGTRSYKSVPEAKMILDKRDVFSNASMSQ